MQTIRSRAEILAGREGICKDVVVTENIVHFRGATEENCENG